MHWNSQKKWWLFDDPRSYGARQLMLGAAEGLRRNGKLVHLHPLDPNDPFADQKLKQSIVDFEPDAILLANHPSTLFFQNIQMRPPPCHHFIWVFDDPFMMGDEPYAVNDIVWIADPSFAIGARHRGASQIHFVPVAAPCDIHARIKPEYEVPLLYVGATFRMAQAREQMGKQVEAYLDEIINLKLANPENTFQSLLDTHLLGGTAKVQWSGQLAYYLYTEVNRKHRLNYLSVLADQSLNLYGNEAWKIEIEGTPLASCFKGTLDPLREYPNAIRSAEININLRSMQGISAPVQRDFLMPAAGGFMLSSHQVQSGMDWKKWDSSNRFKLDEFEWSPSFQSKDEMLDRIKEYQPDEKKRREWIDRTRQSIQNHHTFAHRIEQVGRWMNEAGNEE